MKRFPILILVLFFPVFASADITVAGYITENTTWSPENGVVIIGPGVTVMPGVTLTIEPGTILKSGISSHGMVFWLEILGTLVAEGTASEPIYFTSIKDDSVGGDTNGDGDDTIPQMLDWVGIVFREAAVGSVKHSTVRYAGSFAGGHTSGLSNLGGTVFIENSSFENNFQSDILQSTGSLAVASSTFDRDNIAIRIMGGNLIATPGNNFATTSSVENLSATEVDMRNNWWGSVTGPQPIDKVGQAEGSFIYGLILYEPWLMAPPGDEMLPEECCSNVLFLPGIKGSVLKMGSDTLWPATFFGNDLPALALTEDGESVNNVYVDGILQEFAGRDIYLPFSVFLDGLVGENLIDEWLPRSYDWRFSPEKILADGVKTKDETIDIIEEIGELASRSQTGQVTIVAHSMGGLMGKMIIKELEERGKGHLIDSFVMVGTPQLGTPQAIGTILHGYDESILGGFIVSSAQARTISQNMESAFNLLPSRKYFEKVIDPVITFDSRASFTQEWRDFWGEDGINDYNGLASFLTATGVTREKPGELDLKKPEVLRADLVSSADEFHNTYDNYVIPNHIRLVQLAGWGLSTPKAIKYKNRHFQPSYETKFTSEGDSTVVYPSTISSTEGEIYYFNLFDHNRDLNSKNEHRDMLSAQPVQELIQEIVSENQIETINFITNTKPDVENIDDQLIVSAHSPVILGVYDELNNFTGINPSQDLSKGVLIITEDIPGSIFLYTSESQYIFLPKEGTYNFIYKGMGTGSTTIEIQDFIADEATLLAAYSDMSTVEFTSAVFTINTEKPENTIIKIDTNNDGKIDEIFISDDASLEKLFELLRENITGLNIDDQLETNILKKVDDLEKKIEKKFKKDKSLETVKKRIENLIKIIVKKEKRSVLSEADVQEIIILLEQVESAL